MLLNTQSSRKSRRRYCFDHDHPLAMVTSPALLYEDRGCEYAEQGDFKKAIENFTMSIKAEKNAVRLELLAQCRLEVGDHDGALAAAIEACSLDPEVEITTPEPLIVIHCSRFR
jgi:tetratricopeptide (TPR) repeat protein